MRRVMLLAAILAIGVLVGSGSAQAKQCSADGKICLLTEATSANPYQPPQAIQVAVDSRATTVSISGDLVALKPAQLVSSGPPGGMSTWQAEFGPSEFDGTTSLDVYAQVGTPPGFSYSFAATFPNLPVQATFLFGDSRIRRIGERYVATFNYTARRPVTINQQLGLTTREPYMGKVTSATTETGVGAGTATMSLDAETARQVCRRHLRCYLALVSTVTIGADYIGNEVIVDGRIKTPHLRCIQRVRTLLERSRRLRKRNPKLRQRYRRQARKLHPRCYDWSVQAEEPSAGAHPPEERPPLLRVPHGAPSIRLQAMSGWS
jgi:hypothetical protein